MSVKKRILEFIKYKDITTKEFELSIGAGNSYVNNIRISIGDDKLERISNTYPELNTIWLKMGIGQMLKADEATINTVEDKQSSYFSDKGIPLIPTSAIAGKNSDEFVLEENEIERRYYIPDLSKADYLIRVKGNSMYPKFSAGDLLACMKVSKDDFIQWNKVYVIDTSQGMMIKRIVKGSKSTDWILKSDNEDYQDIHISSRKDVNSISLVIGVVRFE